jgi:hypothetical protein
MLALLLLLCASALGFAQERHVVLFVIDGFSYKAWEKLSIPVLRRLAQEGTLVEQGFLPPPAHPKAGGYAEIHTSSIVNPIMMAGTIFIDRKTVLLQESLPSNMATAFVVNSLAYITLTKGYTEVFQQTASDDRSIERALDIMHRLRPGFMRVHLQNAGSAGFLSLSTKDDVPWRGNIWAQNAPYRLATERADSLLGVFVDGLRMQGVLDNTTLIILGDHGQDDGGWHPLELPDGAITSFVLWGRGIRSGVRLPYAELIDIVPTICTLLSTPTPATSQGRAIVEALTALKPPYPPREEHIRTLNRQFAEYRSLTARLAARLEDPSVPRRGAMYHQLGTIRERFYDLSRFTEWPKLETMPALIRQNEEALRQLRSIAEAKNQEHKKQEPNKNQEPMTKDR